MLKWITIPAVALATALTISCSGARDEAVSPNAPNAAAPADITFGAGAFDLEKGPAGSWRWLSEKAVIKLRNAKTEMHLKIGGSSPIDLIGQSNQLTIALNGEQLEQVTLTKEKNTLDREFTIAAAKQAGGDFSELTISSTKSFVPKLTYKNSGDDRKLSFSLTKLEWEPKQ